jgi:hypothetical protein
MVVCLCTTVKVRLRHSCTGQKSTRTQLILQLGQDGEPLASLLGRFDPGKAPPVPTEIAGWAPQPFWTFRRRINSLASSWNRTCTYWIAQMSLETRGKKLNEIYWQSAYIYWLFQMLKKSSFYTDRLSNSCPNLGIRCPTSTMSLKASSTKGSNIENQVTFAPPCMHFIQGPLKHGIIRTIYVTQRLCASSTEWIYVFRMTSD